MKLIDVTEAEAGQRLDKLLARYLKEAPKSFLYKMLRKKNITLNGKKADGSEKVKTGDEVRIFLSDETYEKFAGKPVLSGKTYPLAKLDIIFENSHILLINKPSGMLTQKAGPTDISLNEYLLGYLQRKGEWSENSTFRPSVCNRLDRNTSGIVVCGKSLAGLQQMSRLLQDRSVHKYYQCLVSGRLEKPQRLEGFLWKDSVSNKVRISEEACPAAQPIITEYQPITVWQDCTLLEVCLITGRSHQIRAHLASIGHPVIGDGKYGERSVNERYRRQYGPTGQLLHSFRLEFPELPEPFQDLSCRCFEAQLPGVMRRIIEDKKSLQFLS